MNQPVFISHFGDMLENWASAFPRATVVAEPHNAKGLDSSLIFLDFSELAEAEKPPQLAASLLLGPRVVVLNAVPNEQEAMQAVRNGAAGYIHKYAVQSQLREVELVIRHGGYWVGEKVMQTLMQSTLLANPSRSQEHKGAGVVGSSDTNRAALMLSQRLSQREYMVAEEVACGATNQEIAERLKITERTVKSHLSQIFEKTQSRNRVELALLINNLQHQSTSIQTRSN